MENLEQMADFGATKKLVTYSYDEEMKLKNAPVEESQPEDSTPVE